MAKDSSSKTVVRRIKANSSGSSAAARADEAKVAKKTKTATHVKSPKKPARSGRKTFFLFRAIFAVGRYFRDSWRELRQVRWTNRRATWALTLAVIVFCVFFAGLIMLFDWIFNWVIQEVIL